MSKNSILYLKNILEECNFLLSLKSQNKLSKENLINDETLKRAVVRSLEIIGEASKNIAVKENSNGILL